ncbi:MAG: TPR end-of-group domain-containing protein [Planctomycetota bacterium]|jgi:tetratricopeptide (TPR) repeat protein
MTYDKSAQDSGRYEKLNSKKKEEYGFEMQFFEAIVGKRPEYLDALKALAEIYTETGYYKAGYDADRSICELEPDNCISLYNLACSLALLGKRSEAVTCLKRAVDHGYNDFTHISADPDLSSLHGDPEFTEIIKINN